MFFLACCFFFVRNVVSFSSSVSPVSVCVFLMTFYPSTLIMTMYIVAVARCSAFIVRKWLSFSSESVLFFRSFYCYLSKQNTHSITIWNIMWQNAESKAITDTKLTMENSVSKQSVLLLVLKVVIAAAAAAVPSSLMTLCSIWNKKKRNKKSYKLRQIEGHIST